MKKEEFEKDINLLKDKTPSAYNDVVKITNPFFRVYEELYSENMDFLKSKYNLMLSELDILTSLFYSGGDTYTLSPTQLMQRILFSSGGMTKILKKLETKKLICRLENKNDGRSKLVQLTPQGVNIAKEGLKDILQCESEYFSILDKKEQNELSRLLLKCLKN